MPNDIKPDTNDTRTSTTTTTNSSSSGKPTLFNTIKENFSWIKDIAIVCFMILILYANLHFVTVEKFETFVKAQDTLHLAINTTLVSIDKTLALMQQNQITLSENEKQIRINTARLDTVEVQLKYFNSLDLDKHILHDATEDAKFDLRIRHLEDFTKVK